MQKNFIVRKAEQKDFLFRYNLTQNLICIDLVMIASVPFYQDILPKRKILASIRYLYYTLNFLQWP